MFLTTLLFSEMYHPFGTSPVASSKESASSAGATGGLSSVPGLGKIPWRRAWQPTPVFLPGESPWTEKPGELQTIVSQSVKHN